MFGRGGAIQHRSGRLVALDIAGKTRYTAWRGVRMWRRHIPVHVLTAAPNYINISILRARFGMARSAKGEEAYPDPVKGLTDVSRGGARRAIEEIEKP